VIPVFHRIGQKFSDGFVLSRMHVNRTVADINKHFRTDQ
jgi:hypothetical protein